MNWIKKTLLLALCLPVLFACGGGSDDDDIDDDVNAKHHYRVEVEFEGDVFAYLMQVTITCVEEYTTTLPFKYVKITMDDEDIEPWWKPDAQLYHFAQNIRPYENDVHTFTFSNKHVFETKEKGVLLGFGVSHTDNRLYNEAAPGPITTRIRVYKDNKLIDEVEEAVGGRNAEFKYNKQL